MNRKPLLSMVFLLVGVLVAACGSSKVPASDVCQKMLECSLQDDQTLEECIQGLEDNMSVIRTASWNAMADCWLAMTCEQMQAEDSYTICMAAAMEAAPAGAGDKLLAAYCQRAIDCGDYPGSVDSCVAMAKDYGGDSMGYAGMFTDGMITCLSNCTRDLACEQYNYFFELCGLECELPFVQFDLDCENGYQEDDECVCDEGWAGDLCDVCAEGYVRDGWDCQGVCQPDTCSGHGLCDDSYGNLYCTCDTGYTGERCESCTDGYQDVDGRCWPEAGCEADGSPCDDGFVCTELDTCQSGVCMGVDIDCDDGVACSQDSCLEISGGCVHTPVPTGQPEGYLGDAVCANEMDDDCDGLTDAEDNDCLTTPCGQDSDCPDDGNPCTAADCQDGLCFWPAVADASPCPGSNDCASRFICRGSDCLPGPSDKDGDSDGYVDASCPFGTDCDDANADVHPAAEGPKGAPVCSDDVDNDCDGLIDEFDPTCWPLHCTVDGWCLEQPRTGAENLYAVLALAADDVWAAGGKEYLLHWDGTCWQREDSPSFWGIRDLCGCASDDVWGVTQVGDIVGYDGMEWTMADSPNAPHILSDIWCNCRNLPTDDVWAVGRPAMILHYDGVQWSVVDSPATTDLYGVWASSAEDVWAVGAGGAMLRYNGTIWENQASLFTEDFNAIWGRGADQIWVAGDDGIIFGYDGNDWMVEDTNTTVDLENIWGVVDGTEVWATGGNWSSGTDLEWNQGGWRSSTTFGSDAPTLHAIHGLNADDLWAVGERGVIIHVDGQEAVPMIQSVGYLSDMCAVEAADGTVQAWVVGRDGDGLMVFNGTEWTGSSAASAIRRKQWIWCGGVHGIWVMTDDAEWGRFGASLYETGEIGELPIAQYLKEFDGRVTDDRVEIWAVGDAGLTVHFDGSTWTLGKMEDGKRFDMVDVWVGPQGSSPEVVAVGEEGGLLTFDGNTWTRHEELTYLDLNGVWGDGQGGIWVVGDDGLVLAWDGSTFQAVTLPFEFDDDLYAVAGTSASDVWVSTWRQVLHFDGGTWTTQEIGASHFYGLAVTKSHVWLHDLDGSIFHKTR